MRTTMLGEPFEWTQKLTAIHFQRQLKLEGFGPPDDFSMCIQSSKRSDGELSMIVVEMSRNELENLLHRIGVQLNKIQPQ